MAMTEEAFGELVQQLEEVAAQQPRLYRFRLLLLSMLGYAYLFFVLAVLIAIVASFFSFGISGTALLLAKKLALPLLILAFFIARAMWVRLPPPAGIALTQPEVPHLFKVLDKIRRRLKGPSIHKVLLTDEFNAAIVQIPRLGLFGWQKNYLLLGLPLMQSLSPKQCIAILAHEYGHLSGAHGRFGSWIYRVRQTWYRLMQRLDEQQHWGNFLFRGFLDWYAPFFNAYSFVMARANEYEADRCSAEIIGSRYTADALSSVYIRSGFMDNVFWSRLYARADTDARPPYLPFAHLPLAMQAAMDKSGQQAWLKEALQEQTGTADTHPALQDRLTALGEKPRLIPVPKVSAAQKFLGAALPGLINVLDGEWEQAIAPRWQERYQHVQQTKTALAKLNKKAASEALTADEAWDRACWTEELGDAAAARPLYQDVLRLAQRHAGANFACGRLMLQEQDAQGITHLEQAMHVDADSILEACRLIHDYLVSHNREQEAAKYHARAMQRIGQEEQANEERSSVDVTDELVPHALTEEQLEAIGVQLMEYKEIKAAYLARKTVKYLPEHPFYILGVERSLRGRLSGDVAKLAQRLAQNLKMPDMFYVMVFKGTGKKMKNKLAELEDACIYEI